VSQVFHPRVQADHRLSTCLIHQQLTRAVVESPEDLELLAPSYWSRISLAFKLAQTEADIEETVYVMDADRDAFVKNIYPYTFSCL
jgi:hypothetical protein